MKVVFPILVSPSNRLVTSGCPSMTIKVEEGKTPLNIIVGFPASLAVGESKVLREKNAS